ncbi:MAG: hypothetical protein A2Z14_06420 [Chloroflexi bacterium RBG_16_48_8]|nr:MAG: hypothetical protein A2Z14_06420 [Chloroflexi bacterium RBG_16_48_8]
MEIEEKIEIALLGEKEIVENPDLKVWESMNHLHEQSALILKCTARTHFGDLSPYFRLLSTICTIRIVISGTLMAF